MLACMDFPGDYEKQVYAGVLGKVIGVYMGRPFEGWPKSRITERWGLVDRFVADDCKVPLVVADDDISGTLTFVRALEDSGRYLDVGYEDFGHNWLNYIIENKSILWWGGLGLSTEHTAYLRLKEGDKPPVTGSIAKNGRTVAEQIGAQIFIDAFGLVTPARPDLAVKLAERSSRVSHDGEAVYGAMIVAALVSAAFTEKSMDRLLDTAVGFIPKNSLIAQVHRDVRQWAREDGDWHATYDRIAEKWGYTKYGGNCHVIPNHALMVMAWSYAPDDFRMAQAIVNTAGWDTDCNAANVGTVMGVKVGLDKINASYDFQSRFADRIILPTAEGTRSITDCSTEALHLARVGRKLMGQAECSAPKGGAVHHFALPGARHGYDVEPTAFGNAGPAEVDHDAEPGALRITFHDLDPKLPVRVSTPILSEPTSGHGYSVMGTPRLYPGMSVALCAEARAVRRASTARLFVRHFAKEGTTEMRYGVPVDLREGQVLSATLTVGDLSGWPVKDLGIEIAGDAGSSGTLLVDRVTFGGPFSFHLPDLLPFTAKWVPIGWVADVDTFGWPLSDEPEVLQHLGKNHGRGMVVTGTTDWLDYRFSGRVATHLADRAGLVARYQGLTRYIELAMETGRLVLTARFDERRTVLGERPFARQLDQLYDLGLELRGSEVVATLGGEEVLRGKDDRLGRGGAGYFVERGLAGFRETRMESIHPT
jgi:ADP-ribosylglycohydrolase